MKPYLFLIKTPRLQECQEYYNALGFDFTTEQYEGGPIHLTTNLDGLVVDLYPCAEGETPSNNRLGFELPADHPRHSEVLAFIDDKAEEKHDIGDGKYYCVLRDPDGRDLELVYST